MTARPQNPVSWPRTAPRACGTRRQPRPAGAGRGFRAPGPVTRLDRDRPDHAAGHGDPVPEPGLADRCRHPIFDEKHYAPQAWQVLNNHGVEDNPGYGLVVHPPVGKQLIAIGEAIFGYNGFGWRFTGALLGVVLVALVVRIVRRISRSTLVGAIAGVLLICDGVSFVTARTALLDGFLTFFVVAAFGALIVDRDQVRERMHIALLAGRSAATVWGPRVGVRWWRFGAGVLLGLACATKWSGVYFVLFFGAMALAFDVAARRQYQVQRPWLGTVRRDVLPSGYALGLIPFAVYLATYARGSRPRPRSIGMRSVKRSVATRLFRCPTPCARSGTTPPKRSTSTRA